MPVKVAFSPFEVILTVAKTTFLVSAFTSLAGVAALSISMVKSPVCTVTVEMAEFKVVLVIVKPKPWVAPIAAKSRVSLIYILIVSLLLVIPISPLTSTETVSLFSIL